MHLETPSRCSLIVFHFYKHAFPSRSSDCPGHTTLDGVAIRSLVFMGMCDIELTHLFGD